jgi:hypothetical protein
MPFTQLNPAMIEWAFANLTPPPEHRMCGMTAQQFYLRFFRQMVLQYAGTYYFMDQRSAFTDFSVLKYVTWRERGDHRTAYNTICQQSPDEAQDICHWWFRREIDGTRPAIVEVLRKVIKRYDPEFAARAPAIMRSLK